MKVAITLFFTTAMLLAVPFVAGSAQVCDTDPGNRDTVRIVPVVVPVVTPGQVFDVPVYLYADEAITAFALGLKWTSPGNIRFHSAVINPAWQASPYTFVMQIARSDTSIGLVGFGAYTFDSANPIPASNQAKLLFTVRFQTKNGAVPDLITIDSSFFPPAGPFLLIPASVGTGNGICPEYDHSIVDIRLGGVPGDADGNGMVNIADVVYLINYIFSGGPPPTPLLAGDADCSGALNIADAVYLVNYIFAGGPPPCEG